MMNSLDNLLRIMSSYVQTIKFVHFLERKAMLKFQRLHTNETFNIVR